MIYQITHTTTYDYRGTVSVSHHVLRLTPRDLPHQRCLSHQVLIEPRPAVARPHIDYFGNAVTFVTVVTIPRTAFTDVIFCVPGPTCGSTS